MQLRNTDSITGTVLPKTGREVWRGEQESSRGWKSLKKKKTALLKKPQRITTKNPRKWEASAQQ